jgi:hypothetical protein
MWAIFRVFKGDRGRALRNKLVIVLAGFLCVFLLNKFFQKQLITEPYASGVILLMTSLCICAIVFLYRFFPKIDIGFWGICLFSTSYALIISWILREYPFGFHGTNADGYFHLALISTYYDHWFSSDFTYKGLSSFYPYYLQFALGKLGVIFGETPNAMGKYGIIFTVYFIPIAAYSLWNLILKNKLLSLLVTVVLFLSFAYPYYIKPYKIIVLTLIIPWFFYFFLQHTKLTRTKVLFGGILGGLLFGTYYFFFFILVIFVIISFLHKLFEERSQIGWGYFKELIKEYRNKILLVLVTFLVASPFILPYVYDILMHPFDSIQNKFFLHNSITLELLSINNVLYLIALIFLATDLKNSLSRYLLTLLLACLIFMGIGYAGLVADSPILVQNIYPFMQMIGYLALAMCVEKLIRSYAQQFANIALLVVTFVAIFQIGTQLMQISTREIANVEFSSIPPVVINDEIVEALGGSVLLTNTKINAFIPLHKFIEANSFYAHPSSETQGRTKFISGLFGFKDKRFQSFMLQNNQFDRVDYVVYQGTMGNMRINISHYPYMPHFKGVSWELKDITEGNPHLTEISTGNPNFKVFKLNTVPLNVMNGFTEAQKQFASMYGSEAVKNSLQNWRVDLPKETSEEYLGNFELYNLVLFNTLQGKASPEVIHTNKNGIIIKQFESPQDSSKIVVFGIKEYYVYRNAHFNDGTKKNQVTLTVKLFQKDSLLEQKELIWSKEKINSYRKDGIIYTYFQLDKRHQTNKIQFIFKSTKFNFNEVVPIKP